MRGPFAAVERLIDPFAAPARPPPPGGLVAFIRWGLRHARREVGLLAAFSLAVGVAEAGTFWLIGGLVDRAQAAGPEGFLAAEWPWIVAIVAMVAVVKPLAQIGQNAMTTLALNPGLLPMTLWRLHRHTLGQSMRFFEEDFTGRLAQKQMQTANALTMATTDTLTALGMLAAYLATMLAALGAADPRLAAVVALWVAGYVLALRWALPKVRARARERAEARARVTGQLVDSLGHIRTVKLFAHGLREEAAARRVLGDYREATLAFGRPLMRFRVALNALNAVATLAMLGLALWLWTAGAAGLGAVAMAAMLTLRLTAMSNWIAFTALSILTELGTIEDGAATLSPPHDLTDRPGARPPARVRGAVRFEGVTFRYGRADGGIEGFELAIAPGEKVGLVGPSGAGKSTVAALLLRLRDVEAGRITLDGVDLRDLAQDGLRRTIGVVTQEAEIFNRSALDNLRYGRPDATHQEVIAAARAARAHDFIVGVRDGRGRAGYDAHLGERGVRLSGGQRQRIALARAILKNAPVLVLDEATSALDSGIEAEIQTALEDAMTGKTVLAIAHRLSTLGRMDRIVAMEAGRIVEQGRHGELIARGGLYARLWARQSGGFIGAAAE